MKELTINDIQAESLKILKDVHQFCKDNNIKYTLAYGTLIGAIRHQGFIPWDNDIDICMPRPDYERFLQIYKSDKFELAYLGCSKYDCLMTYARVFDTKRTISKGGNWIKENTGIWIDIFPLDGVPNNFSDFEAKYNQYREIWLKLICKKIQFSRISDQSNIVQKIKLLLRKCKFLNGIGGHNKYIQYNNLIQKIPYGSTNYCSQMTVMDNGPVEHIPIEFFSEMILLKFEDSEFYAIKNYDLVLKSVYGDYMQLPPKSQQIPHQDFIKFYWKEK